MGLPVVTFRPISGHGRHDASALAQLGLTDLVEGKPDLRAALTNLTGNTSPRADRIRRGRELFVGDAAGAVTALIQRPSQPLRPRAVTNDERGMRHTAAMGGLRGDDRG